MKSFCEKWSPKERYFYLHFGFVIQVDPWLMLVK